MKTSLTITLGYMALLLIVAVLPDVKAMGPRWYVFSLISPRMQNLAHLPAYGLLSLLWMKTLQFTGMKTWATWVWALVLTSTYGALTELFQSLFSSRTSSVRDWLWDCAGALIALAAVSCFRHLSPTATSPGS